jgi:uncharacterized protein YecE (DUF72 family)
MADIYTQSLAKRHGDCCGCDIAISILYDMGHIYTGISGWRYSGWRGVFYPERLAQSRELEFASRQVQTIEINGSHYSLQTAQSYARWYEATPEDFIFSVKGPRYLTHMLRFRDAASATALANFFASGLFRLREKLGPVLWQFPATFKFDEQGFDSFLGMLPHDTEAASALAAKHDARVKEPCIKPGVGGRMRHAVEIRHDSFRNEAFIKLLRRHKAALVVSDSVADWPYGEDLTADFIYIRLHGTETLYSGAYSDAALDHWATRMRIWADGGEPPDAAHIAQEADGNSAGDDTGGSGRHRRAKNGLDTKGLPNAIRRRAGRDVYCYFDNDMKVQAPFDARRLMERLLR